MIYPTMLDASTLTAIYTAAMRYAEKVTTYGKDDLKKESVSLTAPTTYVVGF